MRSPGKTGVMGGGFSTWCESKVVEIFSQPPFFDRGTELVFFSNSLKIERVVSVRHSQTQPAWAANQWISAKQAEVFGTVN